jgi:hypothetical protein
MRIQNRQSKRLCALAAARQNRHRKPWALWAPRFYLAASQRLFSLIISTNVLPGR